MDTMGVRATAMVLLLCTVFPLRLTTADQCESEEGKMAPATEKTLITEIFGDDQEAQDWSVAQPRCGIEMRLKVDDVKLRVVDGESSSDARSMVENNDVPLFLSGAREDCE